MTKEYLVSTKKEQSNSDPKLFKIAKINEVKSNNGKWIIIKGINQKEEEIVILTNGIKTLNINDYYYDNPNDKVVSIGDEDYAIINDCIATYLICIDTNQVIIKEEKGRDISYIDDSLFKIKEITLLEPATTKSYIYDVKTNKKINFPEKADFYGFHNGYLEFRKSKKGFNVKTCLLNKDGSTFLPFTDGIISIYDEKIIVDKGEKGLEIRYKEMKIEIEPASRIYHDIKNDNTFVLKGNTVHILDNNLEEIDTLDINEEGKLYLSWFYKGIACLGYHNKKKIENDEDSYLYGNESIGHRNVIINLKTKEIKKFESVTPLFDRKDLKLIVTEHDLKGLLNEKAELELEINYNKIEVLYNATNKNLFFLTKELNNDIQHMVYNCDTKKIIQVPYSGMSFNGKVGHAYDPVKKEHYLIDEELNIIASGIKITDNKYEMVEDCIYYYTGNYVNYFDAFEIMDTKGNILMPSQECTVTNELGLFEIQRKNKDTIYFDPRTKEFSTLILNASDFSISTLNSTDTNPVLLGGIQKQFAHKPNPGINLI